MIQNKDKAKQNQARPCELFLAQAVPNHVLPNFLQVSSESYATPQSSVAARRVARGRSVAPRSASVPPRPVKAEVDSSSVTVATTAPVSQAPAPPRSRPIVVLAGASGRRPEDRATSVPPVVVFREEQRQKAPVSPPPVSVRGEWRALARARSQPPVVTSYDARRRRYLAAEKPPVIVEETSRTPLPTAGLRANKVPRRFLTRSGMRTTFSNLRGYYQPEPTFNDRKGGEDTIKKSVTRARVLASPVARAKGRVSPTMYLPRPKPAPIGESLSDFPKVFIPSKGPGPSNRSKVTVQTFVPCSLCASSLF